MKRVILITIAALTLLTTGGIALASDISDAIYYGTIRATNEDTLAEDVSANFSANTTSWIASGILNSTANNCAIRKSTGADTAFQPGYAGNPWIAWYSSVPAAGNIDYTLYTNATGGKLRYFPANAGMTTSDDDTLEISDNGSVKISGYFDASVADYILEKEDAFTIAGDGAGNVTATIPQQDFPTANLTPNAAGDYCNIPNETGAACPNHYLNVDDAVGNPDDNTTEVHSDTTGSWYWDAYNLTSPSLPEGAIIDSISVTFRIKGGHSTYISYATPGLRLDGSETYGTQRSLNDIPWTNYTSTVARPGGGDWAESDLADLQVLLGVKGNTASITYCTQIYASVTYYIAEVSVSASSVSSGDRTFEALLDSTYLHFYVDSVETDNTTLSGASIPNNDNDWVSFQNGVMPYVEYQEIYVGGELRQHIEWNYGTTFEDSSGYDNDATPSFRTESSDADVSAELISFMPISLASLSEEEAQEWGTMVDDPPEEPETAFTEEERPNIFFEPLVHTLATAADLPDSLFWYNFAFIIIIGSGILVFYFFAKNQQQALLLKMIVAGALMAFFAMPGPNIYGFYVVIYYAFWCFGAIVLSRSYGW